MKRISRPIRERLRRKWNITPERIGELKKDFEILGSIDIKFYTSTFSRWSYENEITHSELSDIHESNHVDIFLDDKIIIQLFDRYSTCSGALFEEHIPESLLEKIEGILLEHGYCIGKKENARRKRHSFQIAIILALLNAFIWLFGFFSIQLYYMYKYQVPYNVVRAFFPVSPIFILAGFIFLATGILMIYRYKKTSFKE